MLGTCSNTQPVDKYTCDLHGMWSGQACLVTPTGSSPSRHARPQKSTNVSATTLHCPIMMRSIAPRIAHSHFRPSAVQASFVVSCKAAATPFQHDGPSAQAFRLSHCSKSRQRALRAGVCTRAA